MLIYFLVTVIVILLGACYFLYKLLGKPLTQQTFDIWLGQTNVILLELKEIKELLKK